MRAARGLALMVVSALLMPAAPSLAVGDAATLASPTELPLADVAYKPDGSQALAVGGAPGQGVVVRIAEGQASVARQDSHRYLAVAWSPTGGPALVVGDGAVLRTADGATFETAALPASLSRFDGRAVAWKPDGTQALLAGSALLRYWASNGTLEVVRASNDEAYGAVAWAPDGSKALVEQARRESNGWVTGRLLTFDGGALAHVATYGQGNALVEGIAWQGSKALLVGFDPTNANGPAMTWDGATLTTTFTKPADRFTSIAWRPGAAKALLTGSGGLRLAETDGTTYAPLLDQGTDLLAAAWHPTGQRALLVGVGGLLLEWFPEGRPSVLLKAPLPGGIAKGTIEVVAHAEPRPGHAIQAVEARVDEGAWQPLQAVQGGDWHLLLPTVGLSDGAHTLAVRARDDGATGEPAKVQMRVLNGAPAAPKFVDPPARDDDGIVSVAWTSTGADLYEVQDSLDASFTAPVVVARVRDPGAVLALGHKAMHHLRVRGLVGDAASPWSAPIAVDVTLADSPFLPERGTPAAPASESGSAPQGEAKAKTPGFEAGLVLLALAALAVARRRSP